MSTEILDDAFASLSAAADYEENGNKRQSAKKYYEGCYLLRRYLDGLPFTSDQQQTRDLICENLSCYETKASALFNNGSLSDESGSLVADPRSPLSKTTFFGEDSSIVPMLPPKNESVPLAPPSALSSPRHSTASASVVNHITKSASRADSHLAAALDFDEGGQNQDAIYQYMLAAELYLESIKAAERAGPDLESVDVFLKRRLAGALDRVEQLKKPGRKSTANVKAIPEKVSEPPLLTEEEVAILTRSSLIASGLFLPWAEKDAFDLSRQASSQTKATLFTDPDGPLKLSPSQKVTFYKWARPTEILRRRKMQHLEPSMIETVTPYTIRQKNVTDCSLIASLCVCAAFERRFKKQLITSIVYPQGSTGLPVVNASGKYMVKLWLNGVAREVTVDDLFPIDQHGNLLCSHTNTSGLELWVSVIEKAYMKLCGGYDFPGSNSGVDLFAVTGWIPERIFFPSDPLKVRDHETPPERVWERLHSASSYGDCLITLSSSPGISKDEAEGHGLVVAHAYACLRVLETRSGTRLLQLKNPWARQSWKGKFSCDDTKSWNKIMCAEVGYNPSKVRGDDGVFFISWPDVLRFFQTVHLSWNPGLFNYRTRVHGFWPAAQGPKIDTFNVGENPQYTLCISDEAIRKRATVWILLSRHVTKQEQEGSHVTDYLTTHVHQIKEGATRIFYPRGKSCVLHGTYTNNPHVLIRYDLIDTADKELSLVLSQHEKTNDLGYTLSCFCAWPFTIGRPKGSLRFKLDSSAEWTLQSSGGPPDRQTFRRNPMFSLHIPENGAVIQLRCSTTKSYALNVILVDVGAPEQRVEVLRKEPVLDSGHYRYGFVVTEEKFIPEGYYTIVASTFDPPQIGAFVVQVFSSVQLKTTQIFF